MNNNDFTQYHSTNGGVAYTSTKNNNNNTSNSNNVQQMNPNFENQEQYPCGFSNPAAVGLNIRNNQFAVGVDNKKNIINNSSIHDKKSPEYVEFTQKCVQAILEVNYELIRACIEYQKQGWVIKSVNLPDLTPLPIPRGLVGQKLNSLIQQAVQIFSDHKKFHPNNSSVIINSINNHNTNINNNISNNNNKVINSNIMANTNSSSSSSSQQYKLSPNNAMAQQFQQNQSAQQQQNMTDYNAAIMAVAAATNQDSDAYNILRPLVRIMPSSIIGFPTGFMTTADAVTNTGIGNTGYNPTNAYHMQQLMDSEIVGFQAVQ
ncbi:9114_t:CDS:10 [Entrophospora sp. SA101]|nr:9114_t:CDS:10 [Entrophospora sp. SA101]